MIRIARRMAAIFSIVGTTLFLTAPAVAADIPIGPADDNAETSRAVTAILNKCVATYQGISALHATGHYLSVSKDEDTPTTYAEANVTIDFQAPDKLAVHVDSKTAVLPCAIIADGSTVTQLWRNSSGEDDELSRYYLELPQPDSLGAFVDSHRAGGELYEDKTGALAVASMPELLISDDVHTVLFAHIDRFIYEGSEDVNGHLCHKIRFIQSGPEVNVILWIDDANSLVRKSSFIYSYDENYDLVDSFEEGKTAEMMVMAWDEITTDPAKINKAAFKAEVPSGYEQYVAPDGIFSYNKPRKSFWDSLVSGAASSSEETTWTLTQQQGDLRFKTEKFLDLPDGVTDMEDHQFPGSTSRSLMLATLDGKVRLYDNSAKLKSTIDFGQPIKKFDCLKTTSGQAMEFLTLSKDSSELIAWDLQGKRLWSYSHPYGQIATFTAGEEENSVYVGISNGAGVRKLNGDGQIQYAENSNWVRSIFPGAPSTNRVMVVGLVNIDFYDSQLNKLSSKITPQARNGIAVQWDTENPDAPMVAVVSMDNGDIVLQRRTVANEIRWTTMIKPELKGLYGFGMDWFHVPVNGKMTRCTCCVLFTGDILIADSNGKVVYRGHLDVDAASVNRSDGNNINNGCIADLDGDGTEEIYVKVDKTLVRLTCQ